MADALGLKLKTISESLSHLGVQLENATRAEYATYQVYASTPATPDAHLMTTSNAISPTELQKWLADIKNTFRENLKSSEFGAIDDLESLVGAVQAVYRHQSHQEFTSTNRVVTLLRFDGETYFQLVFEASVHLE